MTTIQASPSAHPPAQPLYILRGHSAQVHSVCFLRDNTRLLSGDADGFVILWDMVTKRARLVWRPHGKGILGVSCWGVERILTHGRDGTLKVWQLRVSEEDTFSTVLPVEGDTQHRKEPWLLHSLDVNTLNFCAFAKCDAQDSQFSKTTSNSTLDSLLVAVPGTKEGWVDIFLLPSEKRIHSIPPPEDGKTGMVMAIRIFDLKGSLYLITGTESGLSSVQKLNSNTSRWETTHISKPHTQPILSLDIVHNATSPEVQYLTSSADALITLNPVQKSKENKPLKTLQTKHSGQQSLSVRSDGKIFATGGWDGRVRVYSAKTMKEVAVLKWHKEGVYGVAFADISNETSKRTETSDVLRESSETVEGDEKNISLIDKWQTVVPTKVGIVRKKREQKAKQIHWLAAGSKDGKVSLWEIY